MPTVGNNAGRRLLHSTSTLCSTTSRYNIDDDKIDGKTAHILYDYLRGASNFLPSNQLIEKIIAASNGNSVMSLGYGLELKRNFVLTATESYMGVWCTIRISPDGYSASTRGKNIDLRKYPIFELQRVLVVQIYLKRLQELYPIKEKTR